ncbi:class I SAM-dependent methyltransferase [candidate division KSB1 bacterium]|nr:class I SAM-dependent methyltransferase [candidate division KSB1 bacterium]
MALSKIFTNLKKTAASYNRDKFWNYQKAIGQYYLEHLLKGVAHEKTVLDIGCGEGGVLSAFLEQGYQCTGLEISESRVKFAREQNQVGIIFVHGNIEEFSCEGKYGLILFSDVIEHVENKEKAMIAIKNCLQQDGILLITFPPYRSAFGGHQQTLRSFLRYIPYWHLLPRKIFSGLLKIFERDYLESRLEIYDRGLTIGQFEALLKNLNLQVFKKWDYLVRPRQSLRFGVPVRENRFPFFKEILTTGVTYLIKHQ